MSQAVIDDRPNLVSKFRLLWDDSCSLKVYLLDTGTIAVWLYPSGRTIPPAAAQAA